MYFYMQKGKQHLDLKGDLIISFNDALIKTRVSSAAPKTVKSPDGCVLNVGKGGFFKRVFVTFRIIFFIWGKDRELTPERTGLNEPYQKAVKTNNANKLITPNIHSDIEHLNEAPKDYVEKNLHSPTVDNLDENNPPNAPR